MVKRVEWIDVLKYLCMMCIMFSHTEFNNLCMYNIYNYFYLFGFFFASGYVYIHRDNFKDFISRKIRGILVPWFLFGIILIISSHVFSFNSHLPLIKELLYFFLQIRGLDDKMWFLAALFVAFIPFFFMINWYNRTMQKKTDRAKLLGMSLLFAIISSLYTKFMNPELLPWKMTALPWHFQYIFIADFWMVVGYLFKQSYEEEYDKRDKRIILILSTVVYLSVIILIRPYVENIFDNNGIVQIVLSYIATFFAIFFLISVSKRIKPNKYLLYIGQNTLICFGIHGKNISIFQTLFSKVNPSLYYLILNNNVLASFIGILFTVVLSFVLIVQIYIINRWIPILAGKK